VSTTLKFTFLVHAIISVVWGAMLLAMPGRSLQWLGWSPIDPIMGRMVGATFLALAWGDFRGWRGLTRSEVAVLVEVQLVFAVLAGVGLLRHLLTGGWPAMVWILFAGFVLFVVAWLVALLNKQT
jgi:hypothetical protein